MDENSYEYECMRAELLGIDKPDLDEFLKRQKERESQEVQQEEIDIENLKEAEKDRAEDLRNISGGLHELSTILSATQKKLTRFKDSCGSLTNLLKIRIGSTGSTESMVLSSSSSSKSAQEVGLDNASMPDSPKKDDDACGMDQKKSDLAKALDHHVDKLDMLIEKADNCHYSMSEQNKTMKKFLR